MTVAVGFICGYWALWKYVGERGGGGSRRGFFFFFLLLENPSFQPLNHCAWSFCRFGVSAELSHNAVKSRHWHGGDGGMDAAARASRMGSWTTPLLRVPQSFQLRNQFT